MKGGSVFGGVILDVEKEKDFGGKSMDGALEVGVRRGNHRALFMSC